MLVDGWLKHFSCLWILYFRCLGYLSSFYLFFFLSKLFAETYTNLRFPTIILGTAINKKGTESFSESKISEIFCNIIIVEQMSLQTCDNFDFWCSVVRRAAFYIFLKILFLLLYTVHCSLFIFLNTFVKLTLSGRRISLLRSSLYFHFISYVHAQINLIYILKFCSQLLPKHLTSLHLIRSEKGNEWWRQRTLQSPRTAAIPSGIALIAPSWWPIH